MPPPITLARRTLHAFRTVAKKHFGLKSRDPGPPVRIHADEEGGARLTTCGPDGRGVSLYIAGDRPPHDLILPFALLADAGAAKAGDVQLADADGGNAVVANWDDRGVPRSARGTLEKKERDRAAKFDLPAVEDWHDSGENFGSSLRAACEVTDADSGRYALGCVRLDPHTGRIEATDSHHLLIARGFSFPFEQPVLLSAPHALSAAPLRKEDVRVAFAAGGAQAGVLALLCGDWTIWSPEVRDARFPELDRVVPADGKATATLTDRDVRFLIDRLPSLPGAGDDRWPVTLDLTGGELLVRAKEEGGEPVELATAPAATRGKATCVADRRFLARALSLGCTRIAANGPEEPVRLDAPDGAGNSATVVFATLAGDTVPAKDAVRITDDVDEQDREENHAPPAATARVRITTNPATQKRNDAPMPKNRIAEHANGYRSNGHANGTNGHAVRGDESNAAPDHDALLERVAALGSTLSEAAGEARSLATDLRKLKRRNRAVTGALAGLKKLGSLVA